jgi:GAF domain-containing protein
VLKDDWQTAEIPVVMLTSLDAAGRPRTGPDRPASTATSPRTSRPASWPATIEVLPGGTARRAAAARRSRPTRLELTEEDVSRQDLRPAGPQALRVLRSRRRHRHRRDRLGLEQSVASLLGVLQRFVGYDLAAVLLAAGEDGDVAVGKDTAQEHYAEFMTAAADAISGYGGTPLTLADLQTRVAQAGGTLVEDPDDLPNGAEQAQMSTYLSMPLRGHGGAVVGVLALSSATKNAFGETALSTLKLIEGPAAIVIDNARLSAT